MSTSSSNSSSQTAGESVARLQFLDMLRGMAALCVFLAHAGVSLSEAFRDWTYAWFEPGNFGVMLFFLCSGFIIPVSLERHPSLRRFWISRFFRLYPLYWFTIAVSCFLTPWPFETILANLTMLQLYLGYPHIMGVYWSLMFEMLFYIVMSLIFVARLHRRTVPLTVILLVAAILLEGVLPLFGSTRYPVGILSYLATMFVGTVVYQRYTGSVRPFVAWQVYSLALVMIVATTIGDPAREGGLWANRQWLTAGLCAYLVFGVSFWIAHGSKRAVFGAQTARVGHVARYVAAALRYLGRISYSLYLLHILVLSLVPRAGGFTLSMVVWFVILIPVASLTYYLIEQPSINLGRLINRGRRAVRVVPVPAQ